METNFFESIEALWRKIEFLPLTIDVPARLQVLKFVICSILLFSLITGLSSCEKKTIPKPRGYYRIVFPEKRYNYLNKPFPYNFQIPQYSYVIADSMNLDQPLWVTVEIPENHAQIHISYKRINQNLAKYIEDSRTLAYKHSQKASSIEEQIFLNPGKRVFGTVYTLKGNAASPMQFYLTDSLHHFLRGALYIKEVPNYDSLRPVIQFLATDVMNMIETTQWKSYATSLP